MIQGVVTQIKKRYEEIDWISCHSHLLYLNQFLKNSIIFETIQLIILKRFTCHQDKWSLFDIVRMMQFQKLRMTSATFHKISKTWLRFNKTFHKYNQLCTVVRIFRLKRNTEIQKSCYQKSNRKPKYQNYKTEIIWFGPIFRFFDIYPTPIFFSWP